MEVDDFCKKQTEVIDTLMDTMDQVHKEVAERVQAGREQSRRTANRRIARVPGAERVIQEGDYVLVARRHKHGRKLECIWEGPEQVILRSHKPLQGETPCLREGIRSTCIENEGVQRCLVADHSRFGQKGRA